MTTFTIILSVLAVIGTTLFLYVLLNKDNLKSKQSA